MAAVVVARELLVQAIRSVIEGQGEPFGAKWAGKLKMIAQCTAILASIATLGASGGGEAPIWLTIGRDASLWLMVGLTIVSGASYLAAGWPRLTRGV
jgi:CDP-diacylglycerol--glycerol-3-phosphate 3-phosphatidyltransferase